MLKETHNQVVWGQIPVTRRPKRTNSDERRRDLESGCILISCSGASSLATSRRIASIMISRSELIRHR